MLSRTKVALLWTITTAITRLAPFPLGKGGGKGHIPSSSPPHSLCLPVLTRTQASQKKEVRIIIDNH